MSTQPESHDDLDSTDELPRLDVAAYEASLAAKGPDGLSQTDTWAVEALQDLDDATEAEARGATPPPVSVRGARSQATPPNAANINVARIAQRMAQLETDIASALEENAALRKRNEAIQQGREEQIARIRALEADNERLSEHRSLASGMQERFEQQLREQSLQTDGQLKEVQSARFAEKLRMDQDREEFRRQTTQMATQISALQEDNRRLQDQASSAVTHSGATAASLAALEASLGGERAGAAQLARQLAAKLTDYETLSSMVELRNRSINDLTRTRDELEQRLQRETAAGVELTAQLATIERNLKESRALVLARGNTIAERETQLEQRTAELSGLRHELGSLQEQYEAATQNLSKLDAAQSESHSALAQRLQEIGTLRGSLETAENTVARLQGELSTANAAAIEHERLRADLQTQLQSLQQERASLTHERDAALERVRSLSDERDAMLPVSEQLQARLAELEASRAEIVTLQTEVAALRTETSSQSEALATRDTEMAALQQSASQLRYSRDSLQEALEDAQQTIGRLRDDEEARTQLLNERTEELAGLHTRFSEHGMAMRGLEHGLRARDDLVEKLRGQLQSAQDEWSMMADQLEKSRSRVKSLAQQIFQRDNQIAALRADLSARAEALASIRRDVERIEGGEVDGDSFDQFGHVLDPIGHAGHPIFLNAKLITIGRTSENDVCIPSKLISRHHARLMVGPGGITIEDAGSTNGCFVNGQQVQQQVMHEGDILELGDLRYRLHSRPTNDTRLRANVVPISDGRRSDQ